MIIYLQKYIQTACKLLGLLENPNNQLKKVTNIDRCENKIFIQVSQC